MASVEPKLTAAEPQAGNQSPKTESSTLETRNVQGPDQDEEAVDANWKPSLRIVLILATLACASFIIAVDAMILVPALPTFAHEFGATSVATFWIGTSFLLAHAIFVTFIGALSDIFGRRELLMGSLVLFTIGTVVCCPANNVNQLLAGRTIQGVGAGGIQVMSFVIISDLIPLRQRPKYASLVLLAWGIGAGVGPLMGGAIIENTTWRWLFYINFPVCALGLIVVPFTVTLKLQERLTLKDKFFRVDWVGGALFIAGTASLLIGLTWGGVQYPWSSFRSWLPILLGALTVMSSIAYEKFLAARPFLRLSVFSERSAGLIFFITFAHGFMMFTHLYYLPFYYQSVKGVGTIMAGVLIMAVNLTLFPSGVLTGLWITRRGTFVSSIRVGLAIATLGNGLLLLLNEDMPIAGSIFILILHATGQGFLLTAMNIAAQAVGKNQDAAYAVTMFMFMRTFGMCMGVAIGGTVFGNVLLQALFDKQVPNAEFVSEHSEAFITQLSGGINERIKAVIIDCYVRGFHGIFYVLIGLNTVCLVLSFFIKHKTLDKKLDSAHRLSGLDRTGEAKSEK